MDLVTHGFKHDTVFFGFFSVTDINIMALCAVVIILLRFLWLSSINWEQIRPINLFLRPGVKIGAFYGGLI